MSSLTTFSSDKESLQDILASIGKGKTQLPDFQRGWVWDDEHIRSLVASISLSYPVGAVMMLETGGQSVKFKPRLVEGLKLQSPIQPERLILDGQQRLTSLFRSLYLNEPVDTKDVRNHPIKRWYYLDIRKAINKHVDREEAIVALPEDKKIRNFRGEVEKDFSTLELECIAELFPLSIAFDVRSVSEWRRTYSHLGSEGEKERYDRWDQFEESVLQRIQQYQVPLILLKKDTPKEAVCQVFEKVNTGGVSLNVFELLTATFAVDNFSLREDWEQRDQRLRKQKVLKNIANTDFLQAISLLVTRTRRLTALQGGVGEADAPGISCKRKEILQLTLDEYQQWADPVMKGFEVAARVLNNQKIFDARDVPYRTQIVPLAATLAMLGSRADNDGVRQKLARWYWCGVLGELYGGAIESRFAKDLPEILAWIDGGSEPSTVQDANFAPSRLLTLRTRNSAAYKGISALLLKEGGLDFRTGDPIDLQLYLEDRIDIHHIFPQEWCRNQNVDPKRCDSIINKTPLSAKTNRQIGGNAPTVYLGRVQRAAEIPDDRMDAILLSHVIQPDLIRADNFDGFFAAREAALLLRIEHAMGKSPTPSSIGEVSAEGAVEFQDEDDEAA